MLTDSIDWHRPPSSPRKQTKDAQLSTNQRPAWAHIDQWEASMGTYWPMRRPETESGSGTIQSGDPQEIQTSEEAWVRMWHTKELIMLHNLGDQETEQSDFFLHFIHFVIRFCATIDPKKSRQNSLMFCNASPQAMEPSDKIYTNPSPLTMLEAKPSCLSQNWGPDRINVSLSGSFSLMEYDEGF